MFALGASTASLARPACSLIADGYLTTLANTWMETESATDTVVNPCTGTEENVSVEYKPGAGFLQMFAGGDLKANVDAIEVVRCTDGRARVARIEQAPAHLRRTQIAAPEDVANQYVACHDGDSLCTKSVAHDGIREFNPSD